MEISRRDILGLAATAGLALGNSGCTRNRDQSSAVPAAAVPTAGFVLEIRFSGLFVFEVYARSRELMVSFADEQVSHPQGTSHGIERHAGLMLIDLADGSYKWPQDYKAGDLTLSAAGIAPPPQILQVGTRQLGVWGIEDRAVWMASTHAEFRGQDTASSFIFPDNVGPWRGLDQFVSMADVLSVREGQVPEIKPDRVRTRIRLTRGQAEGVQPMSACERGRKYVLKKNPSDVPNRSYASEFIVQYPVTGSEVVIGLATRSRAAHPGAPPGLEVVQPSFAAVTLRGQPGQRVPVTFVNAPVHGPVRADHFRALPAVVGATHAADLVAAEATGCAVNLSPHWLPASSVTQSTRVPQPVAVPPDGGCIPPAIRRET